jgi:hypothetical protein
MKFKEIAMTQPNRQPKFKRKRKRNQYDFDIHIQGTFSPTAKKAISTAIIICRIIASLVTPGPIFVETPNPQYPALPSPPEIDQPVDRI